MRLLGLLLLYPVFQQARFMGRYHPGTIHAVGSMRALGDVIVRAMVRLPHRKRCPKTGSREQITSNTHARIPKRTIEQRAEGEWPQEKNVTSKFHIDSALARLGTPNSRHVRPPSELLQGG